MTTKNLLQAIHDGLAEEVRADETVMVLGEDVGRAGGVFRVTEGLQEEFSEYRVMDTPLAESLIAGAAIGLAVNGMRPVAEMQFADFIPPAFDQIVSEAARFYYRSNGAYNVPITVRVPYGVVPGGALYHSQSVEAWFCNTPGLKVVAPLARWPPPGAERAGGVRRGGRRESHGGPHRGQPSEDAPLVVGRLTGDTDGHLRRGGVAAEDAGREAKVIVLWR